MTAIEKVQQMAEQFTSELNGVRGEYSKLPLACTQRLMQRHRLSNAQEAYAEEARQRVRRNAWAEVTKAA